MGSKISVSNNNAASLRANTLPHAPPDLVKELSEYDQAIYHWWHEGKTDERITELYNERFNRTTLVKTTTGKLRRIRERIEKKLAARQLKGSQLPAQTHGSKGEGHIRDSQDYTGDDYETVFPVPERAISGDARLSVVVGPTTTTLKRKAGTYHHQGSATKIPKKSATPPVTKDQPGLILEVNKDAPILPEYEGEERTGTFGQNRHSATSEGYAEISDPMLHAGKVETSHRSVGVANTNDSVQHETFRQLSDVAEGPVSSPKIHTRGELAGTTIQVSGPGQTSSPLTPYLSDGCSIRGGYPPDEETAGQAVSAKQTLAFEDHMKAYFNQTVNRVPSINLDLNPQPKDVKDELDAIRFKTDKLLNNYFRHTMDKSYLQANFSRIADHLTMTLRDGAVIITGHLSNTATVLKDCMNPCFGSKTYSMNLVVRAFFWATVTLRVFQQDLLVWFEVPGSDSPDSGVHRALKGFHDYLDAQCPGASSVWRLQWRNHRAEYLKTTGFKAKVVDYSDVVLREFENGACALFKDEERRFPPEPRAMLLKCIQRAIQIKCAADLAHYKCEWHWPAFGATFNEETMEASVFDDGNGLPHRTINRVRFASGPTLICRVPDDVKNSAGLERWETQLRHSQIPANERVGDGWYDRRDATHKSPVVLLDGPLGNPGLKWTED